MLSNAYFLAKFRFDTAENEPAKNLQTVANFEGPRPRGAPGPPRGAPPPARAWPPPPPGAPPPAGAASPPGAAPRAAPPPAAPDFASKLSKLSKIGKNGKIKIFAKFYKYLAGSFSAVSKRNFARKYTFDSSLQALQDVRTFAPLQSKKKQKPNFEKTAIFVKFQPKIANCVKIGFKIRKFLPYFKIVS